MPHIGSTWRNSWTNKSRHWLTEKRIESNGDHFRGARAGCLLTLSSAREDCATYLFLVLYFCVACCCQVSKCPLMSEVVMWNENLLAKSYVFYSFAWTRICTRLLIFGWQLKFSSLESLDHNEWPHLLSSDSKQL